jgi:signal transduction histidine kinase
MVPMTEEPGGAEHSIRRTLSGVRVRLFIYAVLMMLLGIVMTVMTIRLVLIERVNNGIERSLSREAREFRNLENAVFIPRKTPFRDLPITFLFDTFWDRNELDPPASMLAFIEGRPYNPKMAPAGSLDIGQLDPQLLKLIRTPSAARTGTGQTDLGEVMYRVVPVRFGDEKGSLVVTYLVAVDHGQVDETVRIAALVGLLSLVLGAAIAYLAAGRVLRPLRELTDTARSIEESDLTRRIRVTGHDELSELGTTFNAMLDRLEQSFASQKELLRSVNHELNTPLTIIRGYLELLAEGHVEREATIELVTGELDRMSALVDDLLTLAQAERADFLQVERVELNPFMGQVMGKARMLGQRDWQLDVPSSVGEASFDPKRVTQALLNLADNAVRQTEDGDSITVGASIDTEGVCFRVDDAGPGVDPAERDRLFERFERGETAHRYEGSGLGLAIVQAVAEGHGGRAEIGDSDLGGARFAITLPRMRPDAAPKDGRVAR